MYDLRVAKGRNFSVVIGLTDDNGNEYSLKTDEKLIFAVKLNAESSEYNIRKELTAADSVVGGYTLSLTASETDLQAMMYKYDIALKTADGLYTVVPCSSFEVIESVVNSDE